MRFQTKKASARATALALILGVTGGTGVKLKKVVASVVGVVALLGVTAGPAFADCINVSRSNKANVQIAANSPDLSNCGFTPCGPFLTFDEALLLLFEAPAGSFDAPWGLALCPEGVQYLLDQIHAAAAVSGSGIDLTWVFSAEALQSGGLENASNPSAQQNLSNGKGIDLLGENAEVLAVIGGADFETAAEEC